MQGFDRGINTRLGYDFVLVFPYELFTSLRNAVYYCLLDQTTRDD